MSKNKFRKAFALLFSTAMLISTITVFAASKVEDEYQFSSLTVASGSAYIVEGGFWQHSGNGTGALIGEDKAAEAANTIILTVYFGDGSPEKFTLGTNNVYYKMFEDSGWFTYVNTRIGTNTNLTKYINITAE